MSFVRGHRAGVEGDLADLDPLGGAAGQERAQTLASVEDLDRDVT